MSQNPPPPAWAIEAAKHCKSSIGAHDAQPEELLYWEQRIHNRKLEPVITSAIKLAIVASAFVVWAYFWLSRFSASQFSSARSTKILFCLLVSLSAVLTYIVLCACFELLRFWPRVSSPKSKL